jgi:hypothetical protein
MLVIILLAIVVVVADPVATSQEQTTQSYPSPQQQQRRTSAAATISNTSSNITYNTLVKSSTTTKFTCDTTYATLISMNAPHIEYMSPLNAGNNNNTTNTPAPVIAPAVAPFPLPTPPSPPTRTPRRGLFVSAIWRFLRRLFTRPFSKYITDDASRNIAFDVVTVSSSANNRTLFFGTEQMTSINQNPIIVVFDTDTQQRLWCYNTYEVAGADGRAIGALHAQITTTITTTASTGSNLSNDTPPKNVEEILYVVFTIDGTQGTTSEDVRRFTSNGWIPSYGNGGSSKVSVVAQINLTTGEPITGTFLRSQLPSNGKTNSFIVTQLSYERNCNVSTGSASSFVLRVQAEAYYLPMSVNGRTPLNETECLPDTTSPFNYTVTLSSSLDVAYTADCRKISQTC